MRLVDTSIAIDYFRGHPAAGRLLDALVRNGVALLSSEVVRVELLAGVRQATAASRCGRGDVNTYAVLQSSPG